MIKYHVAASFVVKNIAKFMKYLYCFSPRNVRKKTHLNYHFPQKNFAFDRNIQSPMFLFYF
jgi:hypothetical protein